MGLCGEHADDEACGEQRAGQTVERTESYADVLLVSGCYEYVLGDEQGGEYGRAAPRPNARGQHRHEPREGRDAHRVQADAYVEGRAYGEACRYRVQTVGAVEVAVLKRIYYVEAAAPCQYQQRQHARRQREAARDGDVCADGGYGERESEYEVRQGGEALAVAVRHDHDERHGRECRRQAVYRCGRGDEQRGVDDDEPQCGACRDAPCGDLSFGSVVRVCILAAVCAVISIFFCVAMKTANKWFSQIFENKYLRAAVGGAVILALTLLLRTTDYNGAGMNVIENAVLEGKAHPAAFLLKIIFTAVTIGCGFKGGEIVPTMFIGATLGCAFSPLIGLDARFAAAVGIVALFCSVVNCPTASLFLSLELFGSEGIVLFAAACGVSYMLSGYYGLYSSQKIVYSKLHTRYINKRTK